MRVCMDVFHQLDVHSVLHVTAQSGKGSMPIHPAAQQARDTEQMAP